MEREYRRTPDWPEIQTPLTGNELAEIWQDGEQRRGPLSVLGGVPSAHAASHKFGGSDVVGTQDKTANAIPITDGSGTLDVFVSDASTTVKGKVQLATDGESAASKAVQSNDDRLSNSRTPTAHAASHLGGSDNIIGETSSSAYRGDRGKTAYDHSQATGNPHGTAISDISSLTGKITPLSNLNRVMRINGDGVPMIPDDESQAIFTEFSSGWFQNQCTLTTADGITTLVTTGVDPFINKAFSFTGNANRFIRLIFDSPIDFQLEIYYATSSHTYSGSYNKVVSVVVGSNVIDVDMAYLSSGGNDWLDSTITGMRFDFGLESGRSFKIYGVYLGSGLYDTPVYGKDGQTVATNHGAVPINGKRGNGLLFQGNGAVPLVFNSPVVGVTGTTRLKFKTMSTFMDGYICGNTETSAGFRIFVWQTGAWALEERRSGDSSVYMLDALSANTEYTVSLCLTLTTLYVYINGAVTLTQDFIASAQQSQTPLHIGNDAEGPIGQNFILYDFEYVAEAETLDSHIRYHIGDDAVDSQQKAQSPVPYSIMTRKNDGRTEVSNAVDQLDAINKGQLDAACAEFLYQSYTAGDTFTAGQLGYLHTDGKVYLYDANAEASAKGALYIAIGAITANNVGTFQRGGEYTTTGLSVGAIYYGSETPGAITTTAPTTSGAIVRKIGFAQSSTVLFFNPSNDYVVLV